MNCPICGSKMVPSRYACHSDSGWIYGWLCECTENTREAWQNPGTESDDLVEKLAKLCHDQWTNWTRYMIANWNTERDGEMNQARWARQCVMPYADLSEAEKDSDRKQARKFLACFEQYGASLNISDDELDSAFPENEE